MDPFLRKMKLKLANRKNSEDMRKSNRGVATTAPVSRRGSCAVTETEKDVLLGRGREYRTHPGNRFLDRLVQQELPWYVQEQSRFKKTCIIVGIAQRIKDNGGRFLRMDKMTGEWSLVEDTEVHLVVCARLRKAKRK